MKRILFFYLTLIAFFFLAKQPLLAVFSQKDFQREVQNPEINLSKWIGGDAGVIDNIAAGLTRQIIGDIPEQTSSSTSYAPGGAIGGITNLIAAMYANPPASSVEYFADLGKNLGIAKPVYAQGIGFEGLKPILPLWKAFRNIAYLFFTIIFVVMGFAIMFRVKLNPQTVISIQNAIPRIVVTLILVTFSYAIAGLLIDLIYIIIGLGILVIAPIGGLDVVAEQKKYMELGFMEGVGILLGGGTKSIWNIVGSLLESGPSGIIGAITDVLTAVFGGIGGILATLILAATSLYVIFKLFLSLIKCYLSIILSIIFAPLQIMIGILPGSQMGFGSWFRNLLANILVFPAVAIFMLLGWILANNYASSGPAWTPPVISVTGEALVAIIALGMLLIVHKIPDTLKEALQTKPLPYGTAIGEAIRTPLSIPYKTLATLGVVASSLENIRRARLPKGNISEGSTSAQPIKKETSQKAQLPPNQ